MHRLVKLFTFIFVLFSADVAFAVSLDSMYRDVVKSTHDGYLPVFVKNRETPTLDFDEAKFAALSQPTENQIDGKIINFDKDEKMKKIAELRENDEWKNTMQAVQRKVVLPLDLERIEKRVASGYPKAIELYAWMHAKGIGVEKDLIKSFELYKKAEKLNVEKAHENALKVYGVMTTEQKEKILYN
ncbi:MAG: hypothetical protein ACK5N8_00720 [Alphaproteobacteria bacterium]